MDIINEIITESLLQSSRSQKFKQSTNEIIRALVHHLARVAGLIGGSRVKFYSTYLTLLYRTHLYCTF